MHLNLTTQATKAGNIQTQMNQLRNLMEQRKAIWDRLPTAKRKAWIKSGKDPIMSLAWNTYRYLRDNFFGAEVDSDG